MRFLAKFRGFGAVCALTVLGPAWCGQGLTAQAFGTAQVIQTTGTPIAVYVGDFDGDHHQDILALVPDSTIPAGQPNIDVDIFYGDGSGHFTPAVVQGVVDNTYSLAATIADIDGDGISDFAFVEGAPGNGGNVQASLTVWFGTAQRTVRYAPPPHLDWISSGSNQPSYSNVLAIADGFNGGGSLGLVVLDSANQSGTVYQDDMPGSGVGVGNFAPIYDFSLPSGAGPTILAQLGFGGSQGLVVVGQPSGTVDTFLGTGSNPVFHAPQQSGGLADIQSFQLADVNGDGNLDLIAEVPGGRIGVFAGDGSGIFSSSSIGGTTSVDSTTGDGGQLLAAADLNNDGRPDLVTYNPATANNPLGVSVELATASGNFSLFGVYPVPTGAHSSFATADFNGDGRLDLAMDTPGGIAILYGKAAVPTTPANGTLTASPEPAPFEAAYTLTAAIPNATAGTVSFSVDGTAVGTGNVQNGIATYSVPAYGSPPVGTPLLPGTHTLTGAYVPTPGAPAQSLTGTHTVSLAPTSVVLTPTTPLTTYYGDPVNGTFAVSVLDSAYPATGTWTNYDNGVAVPICTNLPFSQKGQPVSCPYGDPILLPAGPHTFTISYNGDAVNAPSLSNAVPYVVEPDITTAGSLTSSLNPAQQGTPVTFTAVFSGNAAVPTGTVQFFDTGFPLGSGTLDATGTATLTTSALMPGVHAITASYAGNQNFGAAATGVLQQTITAVPLASAVQLTSSPNPSATGQSVGFVATVSVSGPFPRDNQGGTVTFLDGTTPIGSASIDQNGRAAFATASLALGTHAITASYGGSSGGGKHPLPVLPSVSPVLTQVVDSPLRAAPTGFTLTVSPLPVKIPPGGTAVILVQVAPVSGFSSPVKLLCTGTDASNQIGCQFVLTTIPAGGGATTLEVSALAPYPCGEPDKPYVQRQQAACGTGPRPKAQPEDSALALELASPLAAALFFLWPTRRRRGWFTLLAAVLGLPGLLAISGCGNCTNLGTVPGNYTIQVVGTSTTGTPIMHSVPVSISVQYQ